MTDSLLDDSFAILQQELDRCQQILLSTKSPMSSSTAKLPPTSSKKTNKEATICVKYSKWQTDILMQWMIDHRDNPFPDQDDVHELMHRTNLSYSQIINWTTNVRKRNRKATCEDGKKPHHFIDFLFLADKRESDAERISAFSNVPTPQDALRPGVVTTPPGMAMSASCKKRKAVFLTNVLPQSAGRPPRSPIPYTTTTPGAYVRYPHPGYNTMAFPETPVYCYAYSPYHTHHHGGQPSPSQGYPVSPFTGHLDFSQGPPMPRYTSRPSTPSLVDDSLHPIPEETNTNANAPVTSPTDVVKEAPGIRSEEPTPDPVVSSSCNIRIKVEPDTTTSFGRDGVLNVMPPSFQDGTGTALEPINIDEPSDPIVLDDFACYWENHVQDDSEEHGSGQHPPRRGHAVYVLRPEVDVTSPDVPALMEEQVGRRTHAQLLDLPSVVDSVDALLSISTAPAKTRHHPGEHLDGEVRDLSDIMGFGV